MRAITLALFISWTYEQEADMLLQPEHRYIFGLCDKHIFTYSDLDVQKKYFKFLFQTKTTPKEGLFKVHHVF